ncbi:MAG: hypothetical protein ACRDS0_00375 [Pseudonocardiaceae bacterium]
MGRLIELPADAGTLPPSLTVEVGDVLVFGATGGHVRSGADVVEMMGAFQTGVLADDGRILAPTGPPGTVLFRARHPGRATIDVVTGDPWHASHSILLELAVDPPSKPPTR